MTKKRKPGRPKLKKGQTGKMQLTLWKYFRQGENDDKPKK